jgi:hypothetical protein
MTAKVWVADGSQSIDIQPAPLWPELRTAIAEKRHQFSWSPPAAGPPRTPG